MLATIAILGMLAVSAMAQYEQETEAKKEEKPKAGPEYYDELFVTDAKGNVWATTALSDTADWSGKQRLDDSLYNPKGVTICNNGGLDQWGRWRYAYVADQGDAENPPAVYQYNVVRSAEKPGEIKFEDRKVIYGGENAEEEEPVDVQCDNKNLVIADKKKGIVVKKEDDVQDKAAAPNKWVNVEEEECAVAQQVAHVAAVAVDNEKAYFAVGRDAGEVDGLQNGVYQQDKSPNAKCEDVKVEADNGNDAAWGVAVHNDKVLWTTGKGNIWDQDGNKWGTGYGQAAEITSAHDRGVAIVDSGNVYVSKGGDKKNKVVEVDQAYDVAYYAGVKGWKPEAEAEEDSAVIASLGVAAIAAVAAQL